MTWFLRSTFGREIHRGVLARGRVLTNCEITFPARNAVLLTNPPTPDQMICPACDRR